MENQVRELLIKGIFDVDLANSQDIFEDIMFKGVEGYDNMNTKELIEIYIEYYGVKHLESVLIDLTSNNPIYSWDNFIHLAFNGGTDEDEHDLYYNDDVKEFGVYGYDTDMNSSPSLADMLIEFGINEHKVNSELV